jgi:hypothetical protein
VKTDKEVNFRRLAAKKLVLSQIFKGLKPHLFATESD